jgi:hypothetical protein
MERGTCRTALRALTLLRVLFENPSWVTLLLDGGAKLSHVSMLFNELARCFVGVEDYSELGGGCAPPPDSTLVKGQIYSILHLIPFCDSACGMQQHGGPCPLRVLQTQKSITACMMATVGSLLRDKWNNRTRLSLYSSLVVVTQVKIEWERIAKT